MPTCIEEVIQSSPSLRIDSHWQALEISKAASLWVASHTNLYGLRRASLTRQKVLAIGNPLGLDCALTTSVASALHRAIESMTKHIIENVIQIDAAINPGNSGGPLLDSGGRLSGIKPTIVSASGAFSGIGFAVPVDTINESVLRS